MRGLSGRGLSGAVNLVGRQGEYETRFEVRHWEILTAFENLKLNPTKTWNSWEKKSPENTIIHLRPALHLGI